MLTTLTGSNYFMLKAEYDQLISAYVKKFGDNELQKIDGESAEFDRIREALQSLPFLADKKLVVLKNPSSNKQFVENSEKLFEELPTTTDVLIIESKIDKRISYYKNLKKKTDFREFNELDENSLVKWLINTTEKNNSKLSINNARYLIERIGANQQLLNQEITKLLIYSDSITKETIDLLTEPNPNSTIFNLLDMIFSGNTKKAIELYHEQRASKVEPQQIIAMLVWQLHILAIIKTAGNKSDIEISKEAKLSPFVVRKSRDVADRLHPAKLKKIINDLASLDNKLKSISIDADDALQAYLIAISKQ